MFERLLLQRYPTIDLQVVFQRPSATMRSASMRHAGRGALNSKLNVVSQHIRFVNLICDARTVVAIKVLYAFTENPSVLAP
jgi:hypothetical protein